MRARQNHFFPTDLTIQTRLHQQLTPLNRFVVVKKQLSLKYFDQNNGFAFKDPVVYVAGWLGSIESNWRNKERTYLFKWTNQLYQQAL